MSEHDDRLPMQQMLEHARDAVEMIRGRTRSELDTSILLQHALVHGYDRIDYDVVWDTIIEDFPPLIAALERMLSDDSD